MSDIRNNEYSQKEINILAVDDNIMNIMHIRQILQSNEINVESACSAAEAFERMENSVFNIILLDHMMPDIDGITLLKKMREKELCNGVPVIAVTGNDAAGARENYLNAGFNDYITKPINPEVLISTVYRLLTGNTEENIENESCDDEKPHILIVDDDIMSLRISRKILEADYKVSCVTSGEDAFAFLEKTSPDMLLLDLNMPEMSGIEFLERFSDYEEYESIPIVCLTSANDSETEMKCFRLGAQDFLTKPFIAEIMRQRIDRIVELNGLRNNLQNEIKKQTKQSDMRRLRYERLMIQAMQTLAGTIDAKDKYTNGHSKRVAEYSREIARRLNMSDKEQEDIYYMGLLHDIGKIGVPVEIINKTSRLTDEEFGIIKMHPGIGADILKNMTEMPNIASGARWHHERYDGRGYPDGLSGEAIPAVARIIGVADAYDAMTSKRSYRGILPQEVVRGEIVKGKGTQFDPVFAEIMLKIIDEDKDYTLHET